MLDSSMLANDLASTIKAKVTAAGFQLTSQGEAGNSISWADRYIDALSEAIAVSVVAHIQTNAVVQTNSGAPDGEHTGTVQ